MFNKEELSYLLICVDTTPARTTGEIRNKAYFLNKLSSIIEEFPTEEPQETEEE